MKWLDFEMWSGINTARICYKRACHVLLKSTHQININCKDIYLINEIKPKLLWDPKCQSCDKLSECKDTEQCLKRHPNSCKRFNSGNGCKHGEKCAYNHKGDVKVREVTELKEKINNLEKKLWLMSA